MDKKSSTSLEDPRVFYWDEIDAIWKSHLDPTGDKNELYGNNKWSTCMDRLFKQPGTIIVCTSNLSEPQMIEEIGPEIEARLQPGRFHLKVKFEECIVKMSF